jgi:hypothetical protein
MVMMAVRSHFRPEFINRIDEFIMFDPLEQEQIKSIVRLQVRVCVCARARARVCVCVGGGCCWRALCARGCVVWACASLGGWVGGWCAGLLASA